MTLHIVFLYQQNFLYFVASQFQQQKSFSIYSFFLYLRFYVAATNEESCFLEMHITITFIWYALVRWKIKDFHIQYYYKRQISIGSIFDTFFNLFVYMKTKTNRYEYSLWQTITIIDERKIRFVNTKMYCLLSSIRLFLNEYVCLFVDNILVLICYITRWVLIKWFKTTT